MKHKPTILLIVLLIWGNILFNYKEPIREPNRPLIQESSLYFKSSYPPYTIESNTLGSLIGVERIIKQANLTPYPELNRIIWYESSNNPIAQNPYSSAYGYCQIILSTRNLIEKEIGKIDWQSPEEQLKACEWLYLSHNPSREWRETEYLWSYNTTR